MDVEEIVIPLLFWLFIIVWFAPNLTRADVLISKMQSWSGRLMAAPLRCAERRRLARRQAAEEKARKAAEEQRRAAERERQAAEEQRRAAETARRRQEEQAAAERRRVAENERRRREEQAAAERRRAEEDRARAEQNAQRGAFINAPVPPEIRRAMHDFEWGNFDGEPSPLAYVGYRVGLTNGLERWDRQRRLEICFRIEIPQSLQHSYGHWGPPATMQRFKAMRSHLQHLADTRRDRRNYWRAVADWEMDKAWFIDEVGPKAQRFDQPTGRR